MVQLLRLVSGWEIKESEVSTTIWTLWYGKDNPFSTSWRLSCSLWQVFCSDVLQWIVHLMHFLAFWIYIIYVSSFYYVLFSGKFLLRMSYVERSIHSLASCAAYLSSLPSWYTSAYVDLDRPTWPTPFSRSPWFPVDNACGYRRRRHWISRLRDCPLSATDRFPSPRHEHGTVCHSQSDVIKFPANLQKRLKSHLFLASFQ